MSWPSSAGAAGGGATGGGAGWDVHHGMGETLMRGVGWWVLSEASVPNSWLQQVRDGALGECLMCLCCGKGASVETLHSGKHNLCSKEN